MGSSIGFVSQTEQHRIWTYAMEFVHLIDQKVRYILVNEFFVLFAYVLR